MQQDFERAQQRYDVAVSLNRSELTSGSFHESAALDELGQENFDAMDFALDLSSEKTLDQPYLVILTRFRERNAPPGVVRNWIFAKSLDPIGPKPQKVRFLQGGFPIGFILEEFEAHLYHEGTEIATNVSPKRVPLTQDEAFQYLLIEHIGKNKGATVPASPLMADLPSDLSARLAAGQGQQEFYVVVTKAGRVLEVYLDEEHTRKVDDAYFEQAVKGIRFKPALDKGKPVDAKASVNLTKLRI